MSTYMYNTYTVTDLRCTVMHTYTEHANNEFMLTTKFILLCEESNEIFIVYVVTINEVSLLWCIFVGITVLDCISTPNIDIITNALGTTVLHL
jgi:hypothetical protein